MFPTNKQMIYFILRQLRMVFNMRPLQLQTLVPLTYEYEPESTFFIVDASDAQEQLPDVNDVRYYVSLVTQALNNPKLNQAELKQFLLDIHRLQQVVDNNIAIEDEDIDAELFLQRTIQKLSKNSNIPIDNLKNAIATLNQGVGNGALAFLLQFNNESYLDGEKIMAYRTLHASPKYHSELFIDDLTLHMRFCLPIQVIPENYNTKNLQQNQKHEDAMIKSTVTIDLSAKHGSPQTVTHKIELQKSNPKLTWNFSKNSYGQEDSGVVHKDEWLIVESPDRPCRLVRL